MFFSDSLQILKQVCHENDLQVFRDGSCVEGPCPYEFFWFGTPSSGVACFSICLLAPMISVSFK